MKTTVNYSVTKEFRDKVLIETGEAQPEEVKTSLDLVPLTPEERKEVALAMDTWLTWPFYRLTDHKVGNDGSINENYRNEREYDHLLTPAEIVAEIKSINEQYASLLPLSQKRQQEVEEERVKREAAALADEALDKVIREGAKTREEAKREAHAAERTRWVAEHGSDRLKLSLEGGYKCDSIYLAERVALELGEGWEIDNKDEADYEDKINPSLKALLAVRDLPEGYTGEVVWIKDPESESGEHGEAVKVTAPYTNHDIFKVIA